MVGQHLACEVLTRMYLILTSSELLFIYKMFREIIFIPRADSGYPHNFMVNSRVFKGDEFKSEVKTNSGPRVCPLLVKGPHKKFSKYFKEMNEKILRNRTEKSKKDI